jgi:hypothetical protein
MTGTRSVITEQEYFTMKHMKKLSTLAGSIAISLLLGTSLAQAASVCYEGDIVTGIKSLDVLTETHGQITIDVDFVKATGFEMYGSELSPEAFPYGGINAETDAYATVKAISSAINAISGVPDFVEISGYKNFYIGTEGESELNGAFGLVGAIGGENLTGDHWDACNENSPINCVVGVVVLEADVDFIYADLSKANGNQCGNAPPESFPITPGITGSWWDETRGGEGFNIEIFGPTLDPLMLAYFYTYDKNGNQMWLSGSGAMNGSTGVVPMEVTSGPVFGDNYNPLDVVTEQWGTLTFTFSSCSAGTAEYTSEDYGSGSFNIVRLTSVSGSTCP